MWIIVWNKTQSQSTASCGTRLSSTSWFARAYGMRLCVQRKPISRSVWIMTPSFQHADCVWRFGVYHEPFLRCTRNDDFVWRRLIWRMFRRFSRSLSINDFHVCLPVFHVSLACFWCFCFIFGRHSCHLSCCLPAYCLITCFGLVCMSFCRLH